MAGVGNIVGGAAGKVAAGGWKAKAFALAGVGTAVAGAGAGIATVGGVYEMKRAATDWRRAQEAATMSHILSTMQVGPFGRGDRPYGMSPNFGNSAQLSLAMHYARNGTGMQNPFYSLAGRPFAGTMGVLGMR